MPVDELLSVEDKKEKQRAKWIGIYIAALAVLLAICNVGGENAAKDAAKANLDATNLWAFFQAKNLRRTHYIMWRDELERKLAADPEMPTALREKIDAHLADYKKRIAHYTSDKKRMEGLDELFVRAKQMEKTRDAALQRDPFFDYGLALLQISIVMASVAIVTGGSLAIVMSAVLSIAGTLLMINGFFLLPGITPLFEAIIAL